jgi:hypothetical protein
VHDSPVVQVGDALQQVDEDGLGHLQGGKSAFLNVAVEGQRVQLQDHVG